ncbi:MAG: septum formation initiator family protein [Pseudomonadota bacterium]
MKIVLGVLLVVLVLLQLRLWHGEGSLSDIDRLENEIVTQAEANAVLEQRNDGLLGEVSDLKTGLDSVEEHARSELGLIKQDETYYLIVDKDAARSATAAASAPQQ